MCPIRRIPSCVRVRDCNKEGTGPVNSAGGGGCAYWLTGGDRAGSSAACCCLRSPHVSWRLSPMGNDQSSQKNKHREQYQYKLHNAASNPPRRRATSAAAAPSSAFRAPSHPPPSPAPPPYSTTDPSTSALPPIPDGKQMVETNPFRIPVPQSPRRTKSHGTHVVPRRSQLLAGTGHLRMPAVPAATEEVIPMPMPMPEPHPAPPSQIQFPVPTVSTVREEPIIRRNSREDPLTMLRKYDTVIIVRLTSSDSSAC